MRSQEGALAAVLVSYSCHNTTLTGKNYDWSGDYAGYAQAEIERRHPGAVALFVQGCAGNINALPRGLAAAMKDGRSLADAVDRQLAKPMHAVEGSFASGLEDIALSFGHRPTREELEQASASPASADRNWADDLLGQLNAEGEIPMAYSYPVQAWRLGGLCVVALGGEVMVDYELRLQREFRGALWVFGYSNDVYGVHSLRSGSGRGRRPGPMWPAPIGVTRARIPCSSMAGPAPGRRGWKIKSCGRRSGSWRGWRGIELPAK